MPHFVFQLDAVLRQREYAERERQRDLAVAQGEMVRMEAELKALNDSVVSSTDDLRDNRLVGRLDMAYLAAHRRFALATQRKGMAIVEQMARQQKKVDDAQRLLAEAAKERKILEKLRERHFERWRAGQLAKEAAQADEASTQWTHRVAADHAAEAAEDVARFEAAAGAIDEI